MTDYNALHCEAAAYARANAAEAEVERLRGLLGDAEEAIRHANNWWQEVYHGPNVEDESDLVPCGDDCEACKFERHPAVRRALGEIGEG